ncbi:MAG: alpha/beta hydrolase [Spirochaetales bacterium]|nr:alpha/beta hydrolase [Candidatus Physcosoma equi]
MYREKTILLDGGDHQIPSTITLPEKKPSLGLIMLHGTGSSRHEVGNGYDIASRLLAERDGILSIRLDFQGCGDSLSDFRKFTFRSAVQDAMAAAAYLQEHFGLYGKNLGILGWSQGGTDALLTAGTHPEAFGAVVTWAGAPDLGGLLGEEDYEEAEKNGFFTRHFDWRPDLCFSREWCRDVRNTDVLGVFSAFPSPVLAIAGTDDNVVDPVWAKRIVDSNRNEDSLFLYIEGMDHTFNTLKEEKKESLLLAVEKTGEFLRLYV